MAGIDPGTPVTVRDRVLGIEGEPPTMLALSHFPKFVTDAAPALADPSRGGMPELLRDAWGDLQHRRDHLPDAHTRGTGSSGPGPWNPGPGDPGGTYDSQRRPLHFIRVNAPSGRSEFAYVYGTVPADS